MNAWIDFNGNGVLEAGERIISETTGDSPVNPTAFSAGQTRIFSGTAPADVADVTALYSRFRFTAASGEGGNDPTGIATSGEVEDYVLMSLGNRVWRDDGFDDGDGTTGLIPPGVPNDGILNGDEEGIEDVTVELYRSDQTPGVDTPIATTETDNNGDYLFTGLPEGNYIVHIPSDEFNGTEELVENQSSNGNGTANADNEQDVDENGVDDDSPESNGISSEVITLAIGREPTDDGNHANSNMTVDFGFLEPVSLGNRVWFDANNSGQQDIGEDGISGVMVRLLDSSSNSVLDIDGNTVTDLTTDSNGYYLFDNLMPGNYIVEVLADNFVAGEILENRFSSTGVNEESDPNSNGDQNDNGVDAASNPGAIRSNVVTVTADNEPTDPDLGNGYEPDQTGGHGSVDDDSSNLTVDFGFYEPVSLGNRVWLDNGDGGGTADNGIQDGSESGINGVTVNLLNSSGGFLQTTSSNGDGYYLFENIAPGDYIVEIPAGNFATVLADTRSSSGVESDPDNNGNRNDNGEDTPVSGAIRSGVVTVASNDEPTGDEDSDPAQANPHGTGIDDDNSNLTVDFGFVPLLSLGNRIWDDSSDAVGGTANDGIQNETNAGIENVVVNLLNSDGTPVIDSATGNPMTDTTNSEGYYLFENLIPGDYIVEVVASNFQAGGALLTHFSGSAPYSSPPTFDDDDDLNDNGINDPTPETNGIRSGLITLAENSEPVLDTDYEDPANISASQGGVDNDNSNLSVDFGFTNDQPVSLGNRVWLDDGNGGGIANNGIMDGAEVGIGGVTVELFLDNDDGTADPDGADGSALATVTTDSNGYYLFDNLMPGDYFVRIAKHEFHKR